MATEIKLTRKDFVSDQTVRWCPGCGDYAILATVQKTFPRLGIPKENFVVVSGIGCSSRFPYYMDTYGIHSIHGRAPTLASGIKISNPELSVWVITGDGDALSIGGNHILHAGRRNIDLNVILFNNRIYGLTKGQTSPTSPVGTRTKSSPMGSIAEPLNPMEVALASGATFVSRTLDVLQKDMGEIFYQGAQHKGLAFMEVLQNCVIFNNGAWFDYSDRKKRADNDLFLEAGQPMIFGKNKDKGLVHSSHGFKVVEIGEEYSEADIAVHDPTSLDNAYLLSQLTYPLPLGIVYQVKRPSFEQGMWRQVDEAKAQKGDGTLHDLYFNADTWVVGGEKDV
jgi:2-oxoglutarate ferredoxin oxidoreductase subunit beta